MTVDTQQHAPRHDVHTKRIEEIFKDAHVDLETFKARAITAGVEPIFAEVNDALTKVRGYLLNLLDAPESPETIQAENDKKRPIKSEVLKSSYALLNSIAEISPQFKLQMQSAMLLGVDQDQLLANKSIIARVKQFLNELCMDATMRQVRIDLEHTLHEYFRRTRTAEKEHAEKVKQKIGDHSKTARDEYANLGEVAIGNKDANSMFDPVKVIGHLLSSIYYLICLAPLKNKLFPNATFVHKGVDPKDDPQRKLNMKRFGSTLGQNAPAAPEAAPRPSSHRV